MTDLGFPRFAGPTPHDVLDALYRVAGMTVESTDATVRAAVLEHGWNERFADRVIEYHHLAQYQAKTGLPF